MKEQLTIIKIGGKVIDQERLLDQFLADFSQIEGRKILVHGGGKIASEKGKQLGVKPNLVEGRRITDRDTLEVVTMVYGGLVNKNMVAKLQSNGVNALGLSGADGNVLKAKKRPVKTIDYGFVGDVKKQDVNVVQLTSFLDLGLCPVVCALTHDGAGNLLNTNADTMASIMASALSEVFEVNLIYCFEQPGVLEDFEKQMVIQELNSVSYELYKQKGVIADGMIPKLDNAFDALSNGVRSVSIGAFDQLQHLIEGKTGTRIKE